MKKIIILVAAVTAIAITLPAMFSNSVAEESKAASVADTKMEKKWSAPENRKDAIERAKKGVIKAQERVKKLEAMTDKEWQEKRNQREADRKKKREEKRKKREAMKKLTPEQKEKLKQKFEEK